MWPLGFSAANSKSANAISWHSLQNVYNVIRVAPVFRNPQTSCPLSERQKRDSLVLWRKCFSEHGTSPIPWTQLLWRRKCKGSDRTALEAWASTSRMLWTYRELPHSHFRRETTAPYRRPPEEVRQSRIRCQPLQGVPGQAIANHFHHYIIRWTQSQRCWCRTTDSQHRYTVHKNISNLSVQAFKSFRVFQISFHTDRQTTTQTLTP